MGKGRSETSRPALEFDHTLKAAANQVAQELEELQALINKDYKNGYTLSLGSVQGKATWMAEYYPGDGAHSEPDCLYADNPEELIEKIDHTEKVETSQKAAEEELNKLGYRWDTTAHQLGVQKNSRWKARIHAQNPGEEIEIIDIEDTEMRGNRKIQWAIYKNPQGQELKTSPVNIRRDYDLLSKS